MSIPWSIPGQFMVEYDGSRKVFKSLEKAQAFIRSLPYRMTDYSLWEANCRGWSLYV